ncbi:hypothetical protein RhiJN_10151 [Ceratobasidium sp. AG-Ba]|nr:hypothetical protein RhiJN_10151 [Ceratobasidium sp. AG-Ba]
MYKPERLFLMAGSDITDINSPPPPHYSSSLITICKRVEPNSPARNPKPSKVSKASDPSESTRGGEGGGGRGTSNASMRGGSNA